VKSRDWILRISAPMPRMPRCRATTTWPAS
jgi:hypothetical protein